LAGLIGVLLAVSLLTFFLMHMVPGGPFDAMTASTAQMIPQELVELLEKKYGLDKPVWHQYWLFLKAALQGDFGYSYYASGRTINELIREHWPYSIQVGLLTLAFSSVVGLGLGIVSAMNPGRWPDYVGTGVSLFCMTVPSFVFAKLMQYIFAVKLGWLPTSGWEGPKYWVLPVLANSLGPVLTLQRYTRSAISDVVRANYVRTARAKGLSERKVTLVHVFKNALTPVVTVAGPMTASLITGSIFIEGIFRIPGLGWYTNVSIGRRDYPLIMASTLIWTTLISVTYFATDIIYALLDPRVAYVKER
jgi:oligopeptide transport system permease protein